MVRPCSCHILPIYMPDDAYHLYSTVRKRIPTLPLSFMDRPLQEFCSFGFNNFIKLIRIWETSFKHNRLGITLPHFFFTTI